MNAVSRPQRSAIDLEAASIARGRNVETAFARACGTLLHRPHALETVLKPLTVDIGRRQHDGVLRTTVAQRVDQIDHARRVD
jgi:hypothetical protein